MRYIYEAFRSGYAPTAVQKIFNILGRRLGVRFTVGSVPMEYTNAYGSFSGYMAGFDRKKAVRINFELGKSDTIVSVDYYEKPDNKPTYTIDLNGFNIVQVIDAIADIISGDYFDDMKLIKESREDRELAEQGWNPPASFRPRSNAQLAQEWLYNSPDLVDDLSKRGRVDFERLYKDFGRMSKQYGIQIPKTLSSFRVLISNTLKNIRVNAGNIPVVNVDNGTPESFTSEERTAEEKEFEELDNNSHVKKYDLYRHYLERIKEGDKNFLGLYIYGQGGIGKSYLAKEILGPLPNTYYTKGTISGYTGLLQLLYDHKDGEILILDDIVSKQHMRNSIIENILKAVLDPDPPRHVTVERRLTKADMEGGDEDIEEGDDGSSMYDFDFNSTIVFITNYDELPQALDDRCWKIKMIFNNNQIADIIANTMKHIFPEASMEDKEFVLEYLRKNLRGRSLSFRLFGRCLSLYTSMRDGDWKAFLKIEMND